MTETVDLFGLRIAKVSNSEAIDLIGDLVAEGRRSGTTHQVATVNVDFLVNADRDPTVAAALRGADVCLADGMPLVWASRLFRRRLPERVAGADLVPRLIAESAERGWRIHVFGSQPHVAQRAREWIESNHPGAAVSIDPGPILNDPTNVDPDVIASIAAADADILCVALGNPKQERLIATYRQQFGTPVQIGIGGSLDMLVGERRRAPRWVQRAGLEWVFRAAQEPARLGPRYLRDIRRFAPLLWREYRRSRHGAGQ